MAEEEILRNWLLKALDSVPVQLSLIVKIDSESFSKEDVVPLADFVNEKVGEAKPEELPAQLSFRGTEVTIRRYTVDIAHSPRIQVVTE
ncbi:MAG: hypothetical protein ACE5IJ_04625 [Thermoplasmata archaeon]